MYDLPLLNVPYYGGLATAPFAGAAFGAVSSFATIDPWALADGPSKQTDLGASFDVTPVIGGNFGLSASFGWGAWEKHYCKEDGETKPYSGKCCSGYSEHWYSRGVTTCGVEPRWNDGTTCFAGTSCNQCKNSYSHWYSIGFTACGKEPCWGRDTYCWDCSRCCNSWKW